MKKLNYSILFKMSLALLGTSSIAIAEDNGWFASGGYEVGQSTSWIKTKSSA